MDAPYNIEERLKGKAMHQIQLADDVYDRVKIRAVKAGFGSVNDYIIDLLASDEEVSKINIDDLITPERLVIIDASLADVRAGGKTYTLEESRKDLAERRARWISEKSK